MKKKPETVGIRMTPEMRMRVERIADENETSISTIVRIAVKQYLDSHK